MNKTTFTPRILSAIAALAIVLPVSAVPSLAASCPAGGIVTDAGRALIGAAHGSSAPAFASVLTRYADVNGIAMFALGQYRNALPPSRRSEYVAKTQRYISRFLVENSGPFKDSARLTIEGCDGNLVQTSLDGRSKISWRLSGGLITDVSVGGTWLALELRSKFTDIVRRNHGDVSALLDFLST